MIVTSHLEFPLEKNIATYNILITEQIKNCLKKTLLNKCYNSVCLSTFNEDVYTTLWLFKPINEILRGIQGFSFEFTNTDAAIALAFDEVNENWCAGDEQTPIDHGQMLNKRTPTNGNYKGAHELARICQLSLLFTLQEEQRKQDYK